MTPSTPTAEAHGEEREGPVALAIEIADAEAATLRGIVHGEIQAANIFINNATPGHAKILDFGLGRKWPRASGGRGNSSTTRNVGPGTLTSPGYDDGYGGVYVAGASARAPTGWWQPPASVPDAVLYEMATERCPFHGESSAVICEAIMNRAPGLGGAPESRSAGVAGRHHQQSAVSRGYYLAPSACRRRCAAISVAAEAGQDDRGEATIGIVGEIRERAGQGSSGDSAAQSSRAVWRWSWKILIQEDRIGGWGYCHDCVGAAPSTAGTEDGTARSEFCQPANGCGVAAAEHGRGEGPGFPPAGAGGRDCDIAELCSFVVDSSVLDDQQVRLADA